MNIPAFTLNNSPYYLAALLVLLIIILILKNPIIKITKSIKNKSKRKKEIKNKTKEKPKKEKRKIVKKKIFTQNWKLNLFTITGMTLILSKIISTKNILTNEFEGLYNFIFSYVMHNNATTIIASIAICAIFILILTLFESLATKQNKYIQIIYTLIMSAITGAAIILLLSATTQINMNSINTTIFGSILIIISIAINYKTFSQKKKKEEKFPEETNHPTPESI